MLVHHEFSFGNYKERKRGPILPSRNGNEEPNGIHGFLLLVFLIIEHDMSHGNDTHGHLRPWLWAGIVSNLLPRPAKCAVGL